MSNKFILILPEDYYFSIPILLKIMSNNVFRKRVGGIIIKKNFFSFKKVFFSLLIFNIFFILKKIYFSIKIKKKFEIFCSEYRSHIFTENLKSDECNNFIGMYNNPSLIVLSLNEILSKTFIDKFNFKINFHCSNLPINRGLFPLFYSYLNSDHMMYFCFHFIDEKIDNGAIILKKTIKKDNFPLSHFYEQAFEIIYDNFSYLISQNYTQELNDFSQSSYNSYPTIKNLLFFYLMNLRRVFLSFYNKFS